MAVARRQSYWIHSDPLEDGQPREHLDRRCAQGVWCLDAELAGEDGDSKIGAWADGPFCERCERRIAKCLREFTGPNGLYQGLHGEIGEFTTSVEHVSGSAEQQAQIRLDVDALMRLIATTLCGWEARVRAAAKLSPRDLRLPVNSTESVDKASAVLGAHLAVLLALPGGWATRTIPLAPGRHGQPATIGAEIEAQYGDVEIVRLGVDHLTVGVELGGEDAGREILRLHYRARSLIGETNPRPVELVGVPCRREACRRRGLVLDEDPSYRSSCPACGHLMTPGEYDVWVKQWAAYEDAKRRTPALGAA
jgi:hypothetical protein